MTVKKDDYKNPKILAFGSSFFFRCVSWFLGMREWFYPEYKRQVFYQSLLWFLINIMTNYQKIKFWAPGASVYLRWTFLSFYVFSISLAIVDRQTDRAKLSFIDIDLSSVSLYDMLTKTIFLTYINYVFMQKIITLFRWCILLLFFSFIKWKSKY